MNDLRAAAVMTAFFTAFAAVLLVADAYVRGAL